MRLASIALSISMAWWSAGCGRNSDTVAAKAKKSETQPGKVVTAAVEMRGFPVDEIVAPGKVELNPNRVSKVLMPLPGRVRRVLVKLGDAVDEGQTVAVIESLDVGMAFAAHTQAQAQARQAATTLARAEKDLARFRELNANKAAPLKDVINAEAEVELNKATLSAAQAGAEATLHRLEMLGLDPAHHTHEISINAPIAGKVLDVSVAPGELRNDTNLALMTIADLSSVWVTSQVNENSIRLVRIDELLTIELQAYPGEKFSGRVRRIADTVDPETRTVKVQAELENRGGRLRPEMFARIRHSHGVRQLACVPATAVVHGDGAAWVMVERAGGRLEQTRVDTGEAINGVIPVLAGVKQGERVVVDSDKLALNSLILSLYKSHLRFDGLHFPKTSSSALFIAVFGAWSLSRLKIEAYPDISDLQVTIVTLYPGHAPEEVEMQVSVPLERAMNSVPGVISRRSRTIFGLSVVDLTFGADMEEHLARQVVMERLHDVELPEGVTATLAPPVTPAGELYRYVLRGSATDEMGLRELQDWVVAPRLQQVAGVGDVIPFGGLVKRYQVEI
ncbi:MAG: efflux RND transporter periplasmic adaptor subunit, partial [Candidatus Solibacter sp.]|nr:efflux RND transporter periplasmic adaptor subunit [Candidatus Solibacter sp.]